MSIAGLKNLGVTWKQIAIELCKILKRVLDYKTEVIEISDGGLAAIPLMNNKMYTQYLFRGRYQLGEFYIFRHKEYQDKYLVSFYVKDTNKYRLSVIPLCYIFYIVCYKIFINCILYKTYENKDNLSFHYLVDPSKIKIIDLEGKNDIISDDELIKFSIKTIMREIE